MTHSIIKNSCAHAKKGQVAMEYMTIVGFVSFVLVAIIATTVIYTGQIQDTMRSSQMTNCANKIISTSEDVFYAGEPSKATIKCFIPKNILNVEIIDNNILFTYSTSTGENKIAFESKVPISGSIDFTPEINNFEIAASQNNVQISRV